MTKFLFAAATAAAAIAATGAVAQTAPAGCNGHIDQMKFGCAPWDHNVGPQFPYYQAPGAKPAVAPQRPAVAPAPMPGVLPRSH